MLVIQCREGEQVIIRNRETKQVIGVVSLQRGTNHTRIGFKFPLDCEIVREELLRKESHPSTPQP